MAKNKNKNTDPTTTTGGGTGNTQSYTSPWSSAGSWNPNAGWDRKGKIDPEKYTGNRLNAANYLLNTMMTGAPAYPDSPYGNLVAPANLGQVDYVGLPTYQGYSGGSYSPQNSPVGSVQSPTYTGLLSGDYNRLEQALRTPGETAAQTAYGEATRDMNAAMTGRGMYGSSLMSQAANAGAGREYMNALSTNAANAVAQRYGMQADDLARQNQFNLSKYGTDVGANTAQLGQWLGYDVNQGQLGQNDAQFGWKAGAADTANLQNWLNQQNQTNYQNQTAYNNYLNQNTMGQFGYGLDKNTYEQNYLQNLLNMQLGGTGASQQQQSMNAQISAANAAGQNQTLAALLGAGGMLGGGLLSGAGNVGGFSNYFSGMFGSGSSGNGYAGGPTWSEIFGG